MTEKIIKLDTVGLAGTYFHSCIDGLPVCTTRKELAGLLAAHGIRLVSRRKRCPLDPGYKPRSRVEKLLHGMFPDGGMNTSDLTFTVAKDGFQTLVFEHAGQMFCSDWVYKLGCVSDIQDSVRRYFQPQISQQ